LTVATATNKNTRDMPLPMSKLCCVTCIEKGASFNKLTLALIREDRTTARKEIDKLEEILPEVERNCEVKLEESKEHLKKARSELYAGNYGTAYYHARNAEDLVGFEFRGGDETARRVLAGLQPKPKAIFKCASACQYLGVMFEGSERALVEKEKRFALHYISHLSDAIRSVAEHCDVDLSTALPEVTKAFYEAQNENYERAFSKLGLSEEVVIKTLKERTPV